MVKKELSQTVKCRSIGNLSLNGGAHWYVTGIKPTTFWVQDDYCITVMWEPEPGFDWRATFPFWSDAPQWPWVLLGKEYLGFSRPVNPRKSGQTDGWMTFNPTDHFKPSPFIPLQF